MSFKFFLQLCTLQLPYALSVFYTVAWNYYGQDQIFQAFSYGRSVFYRPNQLIQVISPGY